MLLHKYLKFFPKALRIKIFICQKSLCLCPKIYKINILHIFKCQHFNITLSCLIRSLWHWESMLFGVGLKSNCVIQSKIQEQRERSHINLMRDLLRESQTHNSLPDHTFQDRMLCNCCWVMTPVVTLRHQA